MVTHYAEDPSELITRCGLTSLETEHDAYVSLSLDECTCVQCLSLVICDLSERIQKISKKHVKSVIVPYVPQAVDIPIYAVKTNKSRIDKRVTTNEARFDPSVASTPVYMSKSPYPPKSRKNERHL
jgi:hypothetical protein